MGNNTISFWPEYARPNAILLKNRNEGIKENGPHSW